MTLLGKSLVQLKNLVDKKEIKPQEIFEYFHGRIKKYNPKLNTYLTVQSNRSNDWTLPISIKDNFCTKGIRTTASSKVLDEFIPPYNATVVQRLIDSGVSFLGKTNMDAWAHGSSTETSDYGPTLNPWDVTRVPGGSSGGSAASVSAYLAPASIGSETAGSIRQPAAWCGVVGLKPTYGRVSRYGVVSMGSSFDCPGPITQNVEDAAYLLSIIAGQDKYDATTSGRKVDNYQETLKEKKIMKIGISDVYFEGADVEIKTKIEESIKILEKLGHEIKKIRLLDPKYAISVYTILQRSEVSSNLGRYDGIRYGNNRTVFGHEAKRRIMLGTYTLSHGYYDAYYKKAQKVRTLIIEDFKRVFNEVDVILAPTTPVSALKLGEWKKYPFFGEMMDVLNEPAAVAGVPAINFPAGLDRNNLPIGVQLMGRYFDESPLLSLSYQFEKETDYFGVIKKGLENYKD